MNNFNKFKRNFTQFMTVKRCLSAALYRLM